MNLTIFEKLTVIKTKCLSNFTHIATDIPNLCLSKVNENEKEWENFMKVDGCPTVNKSMRYSPTKVNGLGMLRIAIFWRLVRMAWLRRLSTTKSTWKNLPLEEVGCNVFDPINSTMDSLEEAKKKISNPVWTYMLLYLNVD